MTGRIVVAGLILVALGACRSATPPASPPAAAALAKGGDGRPAPPAAPDADRRAGLDALLAAAQDAVAAGDMDEFHDCQAAIYQTLALSSPVGAAAGEEQAYRDDLLDELGQLADQVEESESEEEEPPPEPGPVPPEKVASARDKARAVQFDLPVVINQEVTSLIDFYTGRYREKFIAALERGSRYLPYIREQLKRANLPQDLAYLPVVESAFNPRARSRARAQGLWQFIAGTARLYGLRCDGLVDERNDPFLSTGAAVQHLSDLYREFGSWELALAAYNSGAGRVERALRRANGDTDFWTIRRYLRPETRNYVPALWAVVVTTKSPEAYGLPRFPDNPTCLARVPVVGALDLDVLAERGNLDGDGLAELNPALTRRLTPARGSYQLAVPCGLEGQVAEAIAGIPPADRVRRYLHVVKPGDTLAAIARRYGSSVEVIAAANGIRNPRALRVGQTLVVPKGPGDHYARASAARRPAGEKVASVETPERYVVRRGDTLYSIARRFGTSAEELQRRNRLPDSTIRPGDVLYLTR